jgi:translocator protein
MKRALGIAVFLAISVGGGLLVGSMSRPGDWYRDLVKPSFNPPGWVFGPVWTMLYVLIGIAGWRTWQRSPSGTAMRLWAAQMVLNLAWSPVFFVLHRPSLALAILLLLLVTNLAFIAQSWRPDRAAAWLFVPYAAWVGFAGLLNGAIVLLN